MTDRVTGLAFFIPSIVKTYDYSPIQTQLHSVIPWGITVICSVIVAFVSDRLNSRSPFILGGLAISISGNIVLLTVHNNRYAEFAGVVLYHTGLNCILPIVICWISMNLSGHRQRAICLPYLAGFGNIAGFVGAFAFPATDAPRYILGYSLGLTFLVVAVLIVLGYMIGYSVMNRGRVGRQRFIL